jgi:uncharacterized protein
LRDEKQTIDLMCKEASMGTLLGFTAAFVNTTCHWSEVGHFLLTKFDTDLAVSYHITKDNKAALSLRSKRIDVSEIARRFGGGGHKNAAGAIVPLTMLMTMLPQTASK